MLRKSNPTLRRAQTREAVAAGNVTIHCAMRLMTAVASHRPACCKALITIDRSRSQPCISSPMPLKSKGATWPPRLLWLGFCLYFPLMHRSHAQLSRPPPETTTGGSRFREKVFYSKIQTNVIFLFRKKKPILLGVFLKPQIFRVFGVNVVKVEKPGKNV